MRRTFWWYKGYLLVFYPTTHSIRVKWIVRPKKKTKKKILWLKFFFTWRKFILHLKIEQISIPLQVSIFYTALKNWNGMFIYHKEWYGTKYFTFEQSWQQFGNFFLKHKINRFNSGYLLTSVWSFIKFVFYWIYWFRIISKG